VPILPSVNKRSAVSLCVLLVAFSVHTWSNALQPSAGYGLLLDPDFLLSSGVNLMGMGLFLTRVHAPNAAKWFGYGTQLLGLPALVLGVTDIIHGSVDLSTWANLGYAAWAIGAAALDHVFRVEYRDPVRPEILIPYVVSYYAAIGFQAAVLLDKGTLPWAIAGATCIANVVTSLYARAHEAG